MTVAPATPKDLSRQARRRIHLQAVKAARRDPVAFARFAFSDNDGRPWEVAPFHEELQQFLTDNSQCVVWAPIKHGKTEQVSVCRVLWELGKNPMLRVGIVTGTGELATKIVHALRTHIEGNDRLHEVFPHLKPGRRWTGDGFDVAGRDQPGGKDYSVCVNMIEGRGTLGARFDLIVIDDPNNHQNTGTAEARQKAYDWVKSTLIGRREQVVRMWAIGTTWNLDDLLYRLVADGWESKRYKASSEGRAQGVLLWPRKGQREYLLELLDPKNLGEREYARQCDNDPIANVGEIFQRVWFVGDADHSRILNEIPAAARGKLRVLRFWDMAATDGSKASSKSKGPCYTVGVKLGTYDGLWFILDVRRIQGAPDAVEALIQQVALEDGKDCPIRVEQEPGSQSIHLEYQYRRHVLSGYNVEFKSPKGDKVTRALPVASAAKGGLVFTIRSDKWNTPFFDEAESFPHGAFKDQVDALSGAFTELSERSGRVAVVANTWSAR